MNLDLIIFFLPMFKHDFAYVSVVRTMDTIYLHIGMILSTLGLSPHGFALGLYPKGLIPMEIFVYPYIPMILPISSQCGTLIVYSTSVRRLQKMPRSCVHQGIYKPWQTGLSFNGEQIFCVAQDHLLRLVVPEIKLKMHKYSKCTITANLIIDLITMHFVRDLKLHLVDFQGQKILTSLSRC